MIAEHERICLRCRKPFLSTWCGNRICRPCTEKNRAYVEHRPGVEAARDSRPVASGRRGMELI